ncbi:uncharacterized protein N7483_006082 [Penicillium malachiteum]|uniref:uncharacterized protein n=1 Tax=Penicillium malachiteum TaxID=1324776 RepID=UPI00254739B2|nr:uncharacterized protein N7483_006082 [Penicillium malachiteum]KAJ5731574.1 hypothetical protein N7483_006082 [Penicillium malachiteum]
MPVIPDPADFPSVAQKGDKETQHKSEDQKATAFDHISKGPVIPKDMPPVASHEEIEARKKELNKTKKD